MAAFVGTVVSSARGGDRGQLSMGLGTYALTGALVNGDTITWTGIVPNGQAARIMDVQFEAPELDTSASPTATATIGDGTDADGYITTFNLGKPVQAPVNGEQIIALGNGAVIGTTTQASGNIVFTVTAAVATGAATGTLIVRPIVMGV